MDFRRDNVFPVGQPTAEHLKSGVGCFIDDGTGGICGVPGCHRKVAVPIDLFSVQINRRRVVAEQLEGHFLDQLDGVHLEGLAEISCGAFALGIGAVTDNGGFEAVSVTKQPRPG